MSVIPEMQVKERKEVSVAQWIQGVCPERDGGLDPCSLLHATVHLLASFRFCTGGQSSTLYTCLSHKHVMFVSSLILGTLLPWQILNVIDLCGMYRCVV